MKTVMLIAGNIVFWITQNEISFSTTNGLASIGWRLLLVVSFLMLYRRVEQIAKSLQMIIDHGINVNNTTGEEELIRKNELVYKFQNTRGNKSTPQNDIVTEEKSSRKNRPVSKCKLIPDEESNDEDEPDDKGGHASEKQSSSDDVPPPATADGPDVPKITATTHHYNFSRSSICLLPRFRVYSSEGEDITARFQPRLRKILVALIVDSAKDKQGISVSKFTDRFWENMDKAQGTNNRNVNISNLRRLLKLVGDVRIINKDGFLRIDFGSGVKCDYCIGMKLMHRYNACGDDGDVEFMERITELLNRGPLVTEMSFDWLDKYKDTFSRGSLNLLLGMLKSYKDRADEDAVVRLTDVIFMHEPSSANAITSLCNVLYENDKMSIAKNSFVRYCEDYLDTMGEPYGMQFASVIGN
jgi:DNA-binding SARP family transcriptional activator